MDRERDLAGEPEQPAARTDEEDDGSEEVAAEEGAPEEFYVWKNEGGAHLPHD